MFRKMNTKIWSQESFSRSIRLVWNIVLPEIMGQSEEVPKEA